MIPHRILMIVLCLLIAACNKKVTASTEFKAAMDELRPVMKELGDQFPAHERALQTLRDRDPAAAARTIEADVVPLVDRVVRALDKAHAAGTAYVEVATDEDAGLVAMIRDDVEQLGQQRAGFARLRDAYAAQAGKLARGTLSDADLLAFGTAVQDAMRLVTQR